MTIMNYHMTIMCLSHDLFNSHLNKVMIQYLRHRIRDVEEHTVSTIFSQNAELVHKQLGL